MCKAGLVVASIHEVLRGAIRPGTTTRELDEVSTQAVASEGTASNFKDYYDYPATVCISVNDMIVRGIPGDYGLAPGDIVSFGCGACVGRGGRQWRGDAAFNAIVGETFVSDADFAAEERATGAIAGVDEDLLRKHRQLDAVTRESLWAALAGLTTGKRISAVGNAVETVVAENVLINGWEADIIEEFVGHGISTKIHMPPDVLNYNVRGIQARLKPGMVLAVKPILTRGDIAWQTGDNERTVRTVDGRGAAHWEHSIMITKDGVSVLTTHDGGVVGLTPYGVTPVSLDWHDGWLRTRYLTGVSGPTRSSTGLWPDPRYFCWLRHRCSERRRPARPLAVRVTSLARHVGSNPGQALWPHRRSPHRRPVTNPGPVDMRQTVAAFRRNVTH